MSENNTENSQLEEELITPEAKTTDIVVEKFQTGNLLVHVIEPPSITRDINGFELDLSTWKNKLDLIESDMGMTTTSTTLITKNVPIDLYIRPIGFIFDAATTKIENVAISDSGSGLNPTSLKDLDDLRNYYRNKSGSNDYNEVVATIRKKDILGLLIRKGVASASTLLGMESVKKFLNSRGYNLSVYEYDEKRGSLEKFQNPNVNKLLESVRPEVKAIYEKAIKT